MTSKDNSFDEQDRTQLTAGGEPGKLASEFAAGDIVGGTYQVLSFIGAGGMGNVYRVRHTIMQTEYALKTLSAEKVTEVAWRRFQNEAQAIARMNHPNVVAIYNLGLHEDRLPYYVMDLLVGTTLSDILREKGRLETNEALSMFIEVCAGIGYAHKKGIVHRDIKPPNIVLMDKPDPTGARIKIVDFGIAKLSHTKELANQQLTNVGEVCGSPYYMSPEQCEAGKIDARSDIYSLGCSLFEALTGSPPFKGRNAMETMLLHHTGTPPTLKAASGGQEFPPMLETAIATTLAKAPMDRYQSMERLAQDLIAVMRGSEISINPYGGPKYTEANKQDLSVPEQTDDRTAAGAPSKAGSHFNRLTLGAAIVTVSLLSSAGIWWQGTRPKTDAVNNKHASTMSTTNGASPADGQSNKRPDLPPFSSVVDGEGGQKCILFKFPAQESIGLIAIDGDEKKPIKCVGDVKIPCGHKLEFLVGPTCFGKTEYLDRLRPDDFDALTCNSIFAGEEKLTDATLEHITHLKGLTAIHIMSGELLDDRALACLEKLPKVQTFSLEETNITPAALARSPLIKHLKDLAIQTDDSVTPLLESLKGSTNIERLDFKDVLLKHSDYQLIATMKNLKKVGMRGCQSTNQDLAALSNLHKLEDINMADNHLTPESVPIMKKMHAQGLKSMHILSSYLNEADCKRLHDPDTGLNFP